MKRVNSVIRRLLLITTVKNSVTTKDTATSKSGLVLATHLSGYHPKIGVLRILYPIAYLQSEKLLSLLTQSKVLFRWCAVYAQFLRYIIRLSKVMTARPRLFETAYKES